MRGRRTGNRRERETAILLYIRVSTYTCARSSVFVYIYMRYQLLLSRSAGCERVTRVVRKFNRIATVQLCDAEEII